MQDVWTVDVPEETNKLLEALYGDGEVEQSVEQPKVETAPPVSVTNEEEYDKFFNAVPTEEQEEETEEEVEEEKVEEETPVAEKRVGRPKKEEAPKADNNVLRASAEFIAEDLGFELPDVETWDEESFPAFLQAAIEDKVNERYNELKNSDPVAEAILEVLENGGDQTALISLFKEQRKFNAIDTSTPEGKLEKIKRYYSEIDKKSPAWINRNIVEPLSSAEDTSKLDAEFEEVNQQYDEYVETEKQKQIKTAQAERQQKERLIAKQREGFAKVLESKVKKTEIDKLLDYVYDDEALTLTNTGERLSEFDYAVRKAKYNPEVLTNLTLFLKDPAAYNQRIITEANNKKTENSFKAKFAQPKSTKGTEQVEQPKKAKFQL